MGQTLVFQILAQSLTRPGTLGKQANVLALVSLFLNRQVLTFASQGHWEIT